MAARHQALASQFGTVQDVDVEAAIGREVQLVVQQYQAAMAWLHGALQGSNAARVLPGCDGDSSEISGGGLSSSDAIPDLATGVAPPGKGATADGEQVRAPGGVVGGGGRPPSAGRRPKLGRFRRSVSACAEWEK